MGRVSRSLTLDIEAWAMIEEKIKGNDTSVSEFIENVIDEKLGRKKVK